MNSVISIIKFLFHDLQTGGKSTENILLANQEEIVPKTVTITPVIKGNLNSLTMFINIIKYRKIN